MAKSKAKKLSKEELSLVKGLVGKINQIQMSIGNLEFQKKMALDEMSGVQSKLQQNNLELKKKYGDVSVNIQDGSINYNNETKLNS
tara:strand:+ start:197 stop:454 length:258 start_codon:yes stop_codon:yes gene_type:complete